MSRYITDAFNIIDFKYIILILVCFTILNYIYDNLFKNGYTYDQNNKKKYEYLFDAKHYGLLLPLPLISIIVSSLIINLFKKNENKIKNFNPISLFNKKKNELSNKEVNVDSIPEIPKIPIKVSESIVKESEPEPVVKESEPVVKEPEPVVKEPEPVVKEPEPVVKEPEPLVSPSVKEIDEKTIVKLAKGGMLL